MMETFRRLPTNVIPSHYDLTIRADLKTCKFEGEVIIDVQVAEKTKEIILNSKNLKIKHAQLEDDTKNEVKISIDEVREWLTLQFESEIEVGKFRLRIEYSGEINDGLNGFYRSKSGSSIGGVTFMVPNNARKVLPCWDEPALKATFQVTLIASSELVSLSNTLPFSVTPDPGNSSLSVTKFERTPKMSTYLLAFVIAELDSVSGKTRDGTLVRIFTPKGRAEQGTFALEVSIKSVEYYTDYFNIPYPLSKLDMVAVADFAFGAMENWGLVTYRETALLIDAENSSLSTRQAVALTVSHEIAHQWFGNLVTMEWWTHLWLNEGFASFVEFLCVDKLFPSYEIWIQFVTQMYTRALELDALHNSHAIEVSIGHPAEIDEIFDAISYSKGASVIRMLHRYLGDEKFRKGMELYLNKHKYANAQTEDLWDSLEEASKKPVRSIMTTWTKQKGFPVISVTQTQEGTNRILKLKQEKFCADGKLPESEKDTIWMAPVTFITSSSPSKVVHETLLSTAQSTVVIENVAPGDWVKLNQDTVGVFRVRYSPEMLQQLLPAVESKALPPLDRLGLQNDLFALVQAGRSKTIDVLKLMSAFKHEDDFAVWSSINSCLGRMNVLLSHTDFQESFHTFGRQLLSEIHSKLGWEAKPGEKHMDTLLRSLVIGRLASFQEPQILERARKLFENYAAGTGMIPADIRSAVYMAVAQSCDETTFNMLFKLYRDTELHEEKDRVSRALGACNQQRMIERVLQFAMSDEVRNQDSIFVVASVAMTKTGRERAWDFFKENKSEFHTRYTGGPLISRLVKNLTENFATEERAIEIAEFFAKNNFPGTERTVQQSLETIRLNTEWLNRDANDIKSYLQLERV